MDLKCDDIKKYVVKIKYHENGEQGSGIIVKPKNTSNICYVLTARHTFGNSTIKKEEINLKKISIYKHDGYKFIEFFCDDLIIVNDIYDLAILFLNVKQNNLENIDPILILNHEFRDCIVVGYPTIGEGEIKPYDCQHDKTGDNDDDATFQVLSFQPFQTFKGKEVNNIVGLSGGGVFTKGSDDKYYLVGIETDIRLPQNFLCLDLREIAEKINEHLQEEIGLKGYSFSKEIGIDPKKLDLDKIKNELSDSGIEWIEKIKGKIPAEQLEYLKDNNSDFKNFHGDIKSAIKKIADTYLYRSILFHDEYDDNRRATNNFKTAIEYYPSYTAYFQKAKFERDHRAKNTEKLPSSDEKSLEQQEKRCKTALETETVEEDNDSKLTLLHNLKSILSKKLTLVSDKQEKLTIYDELIETYFRILNIYLNDEKNAPNNIEKVKLYREFGILYINIGEYDKEKFDVAKHYLRKSLELSSNHTALKASAYRNLAYISAKQSLFKEAVKYYQQALKLYRHLQKKNNTYTKEIISTLNDLAVVTDKLDKEDVIDVRRYYKEAFDNLKLLDKDSEVYHQLRIRTENNLKTHRKKTEEMANQRYLSNNILGIVSSLNERVDDLTKTLNQIHLDNNEKKTANDSSKPLNFIQKLFKFW
jgi:tetratricopeptide (TPR) repeat protein